MPYPTDQTINTGSYVPTTNIWDVQQLQAVNVNSQEFKELLVRLYQNVNNIALVLNTKESAFYATNQFVTGQSWFNPLSTDPEKRRGSFRLVVNMGALVAGVKTVAHNLSTSDQWKFTYIGGVASNTTTRNYYPLPFSGAAGNNIELRVDATNVIINNNSGAVFTDAYVVLEFLKS